jgi:hypothetical protein
MGGHRGGNPRERNDRPLQGDGEHYDDRDELTLHIQELICPGAPTQIAGSDLHALHELHGGTCRTGELRRAKSAVTGSDYFR